MRLRSENYKKIFESECKKQAVEMTDEIFDMIVHKVTVEKGLELAAYHPRFIVDQVIATCRFMREVPHFEPRFIDYAIDNLRVRQSNSKKVNAGADVSILSRGSMRCGAEAGTRSRSQISG